MSILIKGMKMPQNCDACPMLYEYRFCSLTDDHASSIQWETEKARMPNCPLEEVPTIEPKKGKWITLPPQFINITFDECKCSECGVVEYFNAGWKKFNFCPNCGARMDVADNDVGKMERSE